MFITLQTFAQLQHPRFNSPMLQQLNKPQFQREQKLPSRRPQHIVKGNTFQINGMQKPLDSISYSAVAEDF